MKNQKGFASIILVVVIVVIAGAVGYFAFVRKSEPIAGQIPTPTPTQTKTTTPTPKDETANWKTYRISGYNGYEFKYPQNDAVITGSELENNILNASGYWSARGGVTEAAVIDSKSTFSVGRHGYIANLADCKKITWPNGSTEELLIKKIINGITYYYGMYTGAAAGTSTRVDVYHAFGGSGGDGCFELVISTSPSLVNRVSNVADQILSTFKFTK
ncbi:MAG: hypothetical protein Q7R92_00905 [bacterium]|nr:hypothetical protein [bacterium]